MTQSPYAREFPAASKRPPVTPRRPEQPPPPRRRPQPLREALVVGLTLLLAAGIIGGGYFVANHVTLPTLFSNLLPPTPVPPLTPVAALAQIQHLYSAAQISVRQPLDNEVDLVTTQSGATDNPLSPLAATQILGTYLRGYSHQRFWRWVDLDHISQSATTYEVHTNELWVIRTDITVCSSSWTVFALDATEIIRRSVSQRDYSTGIASHLVTGNTITSNPYIGC